MHWYKEVFRKYAVFKGRAQRKEYWMFTLINIVVLFILGALGSMDGSLGSLIGLVYGVYLLAAIIPSISVTVRRLHDINKSGWWFLITLIPVLGGLILLIFTVLDSTPGDNKYGPNPKGVAAAGGTPPSTPPATPTATV